MASWQIEAKQAGYSEEEIADMAIQRASDLKEIYGSQIGLKLKFNKLSSNTSTAYTNAEAVREALSNATRSESSRSILVSNSELLYATNPIYAGIIDYFTKMFLWRYKVVPKALEGTKYREKDYEEQYRKMVSIVDGMALPININRILTKLYVDGSVFYTTTSDEASETLTTILLEPKYCRIIGQTQYGTNIVMFNYQYFSDLGLSQEQLDEALQQFPQEMQTQYNQYLSDADLKWQVLDARFTSAIRLNENNIPVYFYEKAAIMNYENYNDNELERNENKLKYLVSHKMPVYQDQLILDPAEVKVIHKNLAKIVNNGDRTRLITTYGDVNLHKMGDTSEESEILLNGYNTVYNNAGLNHVLFTGDSVTALNDSVTMDQSKVWNYVEEIMVFYNMTINNWFEFGDYEAAITMLRISPYTYDTDLTRYQNAATLGIGKLDYMIASGIKQDNINDQFILEQHLKLDQIQPLKTSYTQTDNSASGSSSSSGTSGTKSSSTTKDNAAKTTGTSSENEG